MSRYRFFVDTRLSGAPDEPETIPLSSDDFHHAARVLRLTPGDEIDVVAPDRTAYTVVIVSIGPDQMIGEVVGRPPAVSEPRVTLIQGLAKGAKMDLVIEKCVELGVEAVWPIEFVRSVVHLEGAKAAEKGARWRRVATAAAKQSGRTFIPHIADPSDSTTILERLSVFDRVVVPWEEALDAPGMHDALKDLPGAASVAVIVGPEGGLTEQEVAAVGGIGAHTVSLGSTILRTETAGILSAALCVYELGGLGGRLRG